MRKIKVLTCCLLFLIAAACAAKSDKMRVEGKVEVSEGLEYSLTLRVGEERVAFVPDSLDGNFSFEWTCDSSDFVSLMGSVGSGDDRWQFTESLFVVPGKDVKMVVRLGSKGVDIAFAGKDNNNNALGDYQQYYREHSRELWMNAPVPEELEGFMKGFYEKADELIVKYNPDDEVRQYLTICGYVEFLGSVDQIPFIYRGTPREQLPTNLRDVVPTPDKVLNNAMAMKFPDKTRQAIESYLRRGAQGQEEQIRLLKEQFTHPLVVDMVLESILEDYLNSSDRTQSFEERLARFERMCEHLPKKGGEMVEMFRAKRFAVEGADLPDVIIEDVNGKQSKLSDLKGDNLYIDLWASWCVPCCKEVPDLQKMEKRVKNKNLKFVSISLDKDKDAWRQRMKQLGMGGHQFVVVGDELLNMLNVKGIPHFLIYNKEGKMVQYNAPKPSSGDVLKKVLEGLE